MCSGRPSLWLPKLVMSLGERSYLLPQWAVGIMLFGKKEYVEGGDQMSKTLKNLTILVVVSLAVIGGIWEGQFDSLAEHLDQLQRNQSQELD